MNRNTRNNKRNSRPAAYDRVVMLVNVSQKGGEVVLRAMKGWDKVHASTTLQITPADLQAVEGLILTSDSARLIAIVKAMKLLQSKLPGGKRAAYRLYIVQSSNHVHGWLTGEMERKADTVVKLHEFISRLSQHFAQVDYLKRKAAVISGLITDGIGKSSQAPQSAENVRIPA